MKIPFDIKFRPQIESGEYKVETRNGKKVRIICWDRRGERPLVVLIQHLNGYDEGLFYYENGLANGVGQESNIDLFIVTPEEELTEFESNVRTCITENLTTHIKGGSNVEISSTVFIDDDTTKKLSSELFLLVREQFIKDGYVIEKKAFHDAVEKVDPKVMKEVSDKVDMEEALRLEYEKGKAEALKEFEEKCKVSSDIEHGLAYGLGYKAGKADALIDEITKLPGFKEDEK